MRGMGPLGYTVRRDSDDQELTSRDKWIFGSVLTILVLCGVFWLGWQIRLHIFETNRRMAAQEEARIAEAKLPPIETEFLGIDQFGSATYKVSCPVKFCNETRLREMTKYHPGDTTSFKGQGDYKYDANGGWSYTMKRVPVSAGAR